MTPDPQPLPGLDEAPPEGLRVVVRVLCGRPLHDRIARQWRLGPECREKLKLRLAPSPPPHEPAQETLPGV